MREVDAGHSEKLPLVAYHGTGRLWTQRHTWKATRSRRHRSRRDGYADCLEAQSDSKTFVEWLERMERIEMQEGKTPLVLRAVRDAICLLVPSCTDLRYRFADNEVVATFEDGRRLPIRMLSDGFQTMIGLIADLAWRCATLNPFLGEGVTQETEGVVLIDEIDLHLHPNWQRRVVDDLRRCFPKVQFFLTTHSPFIVQSLRAGEVIALSGPAHLEKPPYKRSVEEIAEDVLGVEDVKRSARFLEMQRAAAELLANLAKAKGFFSVWMDVFAKDVDMRRRLIATFPGTAQDCFDPTSTAPIAREGGRL